MRHHKPIVSASNEELWTHLKNGDPEALTSIYKATYRTLYSYGLKISGDKDLTKDSIQEIFSELWKKRDSLGAVHNVKSYLLTYLRRQIYHSINRHDKEVAQSQYYAMEFDISLSHEDLLIQEQLSQDMKLQLSAALARLTPRQKEVIYLRFFDGLTCEAISEITAIKYQSVVNLIHEAVKSLREHMAFASSLIMAALLVF